MDRSKRGNGTSDSRTSSTVIFTYPPPRPRPSLNNQKKQQVRQIPPVAMSERDPHVDNVSLSFSYVVTNEKTDGESSSAQIKAVLIAHVVWYHALLVYFEKPVPAGLDGYEAVLLLVVMPGFAFISGYLSSPEMTWRRAFACFTLLVVYHTFVVINWVNGTIGIAVLNALNKSHANASSNGSDGGNGSAISTTRARFPLPFYQPTELDHRPDGSLPVTWFLMALIFWRTLTPLLARLHRPLLTCCIVGYFMLCTDAGFGTQQIGSYRESRAGRTRRKASPQTASTRTASPPSDSSPAPPSWNTSKLTQHFGALWLDSPFLRSWLLLSTRPGWKSTVD